jgi:hypothetical protein
VGDGIAQSAIDGNGIAAGLEGYAFALRRCRSRPPAPGGVAPSPTSRKRAFRATRKRSSLSSIHEKARPFSRPFRNHQGKVDLSLDSSGAILLRTALPIAIRSFTLKGSYSILANILVARRLPNLARQQQHKPKPHEARRATAQGLRLARQIEKERCQKGQ